MPQSPVETLHKVTVTPFQLPGDVTSFGIDRRHNITQLRIAKRKYRVRRDLGRSDFFIRENLHVRGMIDRREFNVIDVSNFPKLFGDSKLIATVARLDVVGLG